MPGLTNKLNLLDVIPINKKTHIKSLSLSLSLCILISTSSYAEPEKQILHASDIFMNLGTKNGILGGEDQKSFERDDIKNQILTFVPPLLRPAFTGHAYTLPPGVATISLSQRFTKIDGEKDIFKDGEENVNGFKNFDIQRNLTDLDFFYGFEAATLRINVPFKSSTTDGSVSPNGQTFIDLENAGSSQGIGDISIYLKRKLFDQGNNGFGLAIAGAVFLPTGKHNDTFGSRGRITARRPTPPNLTAAQGFDAVQQANVDNGTWGDKRCFFNNFNQANRSLCDGPAAGNGSAFNVPSAGPLSFADGGPNEDNQFVGDFPFNNGVFGRFSGDGRLPSILQPGTGGPSFLLGVFGTRQFDDTSYIGRSALHLGVTHKFVTENDGVDFGDTTTYFASLVKPLIGDKLALDLTFVGFDQQNDSYAGKIPEPEIHSCNETDLALGVSSCNALGDEIFLFDLADRPSFSGGFTGNVAASLIYSPAPQIRLTTTVLARVIDPDLGPAPPLVFRLGVEVTF